MTNPAHVEERAVSRSWFPGRGGDGSLNEGVGVVGLNCVRTGSLVAPPAKPMVLPLSLSTAPAPCASADCGWHPLYYRGPCGGFRRRRAPQRPSHPGAIGGSGGAETALMWRL